MREPFRELPRAAQFEIAAAVLAYMIAVTLVAPYGRPEVIAGLVTVFALASLVKPIPNPSGGTNVPNMGVIIVAALLWKPAEVLAGVGVGSFLGFLLFRRSEVWRAANNAQMWGLPAGAAAAVAHLSLPHIPLGLLSLVIASVLAVATHRASNMCLFALYRSQRFRLPFLADWLHNMTLNLPSQLLSAPLAVVLAVISDRLGSVQWGLALTALSALGLPVARQELAYYQRSQEMMDEIVEAMVRALEGMDPTARAHGERVSNIAVETGRRLRMPERELLALRLAARLHDVGLLAGHETAATDEQLAEIGSRVLGHFPDPMIAEIVRSHHERWDGKGGPDRKVGMAIPLGARILAAAAIYDCALEGLRPFEFPRSQEDAASYLISLAGTVLDPKIVMVLLRVAAEQRANLATAG